MTGSGFTDEPPVGPRGVDLPFRDARGAVRSLVFEPVRAGERGRTPALGGRGFRLVVRPDRLRPVVPAQDEDPAMKTKLMMAAAMVIGGSSSAFACPVCFG